MEHFRYFTGFVLSSTHDLPIHHVIFNFSHENREFDVTEDVFGLSLLIGRYFIQIFRMCLQIARTKHLANVKEAAQDVDITKGGFEMGPGSSGHKGRDFEDLGSMENNDGDGDGHDGDGDGDGIMI
jgi:hypothetical protein